MAIAGLVLGMGIGLAIIAFKHWLIGEIVSALDDEVKASCDCQLAFDSFDLSLLRLQGTVKNVRLLEKGVSRLSFTEARAKFSIDEIRDRRIILEKIDLLGGYVDGVGEESATYRFIDQLTAPVAPENDRPGRWRVILDALEVHPAHFREPLENGEIRGDDVSLYVQRNGENFVLTPRLGSLRLRFQEEADRNRFRDLVLGEVTSSLVVMDRGTRFNSISVTREANTAHATAFAARPGNDLEGSLRFRHSFSYLDAPSWLHGVLHGTGTISGTLGSPRVHPSIAADETSPPYAQLGPLLVGPFPSVAGEAVADLNHGKPFVEVRNLAAANNSSVLTSTEPLYISGQSIRGAFNFSARTFTFKNVTASNMDVHISFDGAPGKVVTAIRGGSQDVAIEGFSLGPAAVRAELAGPTLSFHINRPNSDGVSIDGSAAIPENSDPRLNKTTIVFTRAPLLDGPSSPLAEGTFEVEGPFDLGALKGSGNLSILPPVDDALASFTPAYASLKLDGGKFIVQLDQATPFKGTAAIDILGGPGKADLHFDRTPLGVFHKGLACGTLTGKFSYAFPGMNLTAGSGAFDVSEMSAGCDPYSFSFTRPRSLPISNGALFFKEVTVGGFESSIDVDGQISLQSGYKLHAGGKLVLSSLLPFVESFENLGGLLTADLDIDGPLGAPEVRGKAAIQDAEVSLASPDISALGIGGTLQLDGDTIDVSELKGEVNGGSFAITGQVRPFDLVHSSATLSLSEVQIAPIEDANLVFSGDITVATAPSGRPSVTGTITLDEGDLKKDLNPNRMVVQSLTNMLLPGPQQQASAASGRLPDVDLGIHITAGRNLFVTTTFLGAELNADINVTGNLNAPQIKGAMQTLRGWVGLKGNRFEITSGQVLFKPDVAEPVVEIVAEGTVRSNRGENILVILEATGPLRSPKIALSSDRGQSHDELLLLVTSNRNVFGQTALNRAGAGLEEEEEGAMFQRSSFSGLKTFVRSLTRLDMLAFEPMFSPYTGAVEPAVIARKKLTEQLALIGQSTFGTVSDSRAGLVYNFTPTLKVAGTAQSVSTRRNTALAVDLTYTIWSEQDRFLKIDTTGAEALGAGSVLQAARISEGSRIRPVDVKQVAKAIEDYYRSLGYLDARAEVSCTHAEVFCRELRIAITEGTIAKIGAVAFDGDDLRTLIGNAYAVPDVVGSNATASTLKDAEGDAIRSLRSEGYLGARVSAHYVRDEQLPSRVALTLNVDARPPVSFIFKGNTVFTAEDFLDSIDLFKRRRPFGNNTIKLLVDSILRMYREAGYFYASTDVSASEDPSGRLTYIIAITEDTKATVSEVRFEGNTAIDPDRLLATVRSAGTQDTEEILHPKAVVPDSLEASKLALAQAYIELGFPESQVDYRLEPDNSGSTIAIVYTIVEGPRVQASSIDLQGYPDGLKKPVVPDETLSVPSLNRYLTTVTESLRENGFLYPSLSANLDPSGNRYYITVDPGTPTYVQAVRIEGLSRIERDVVTRRVTFSEGTRWSGNAIAETKRNLLKLGLFSRVDVVPEDGNLDSASEALVIRVQERELRTLEVGTGLNSEYGLHLFGEAVDKAIFKDGRSLAFRVDTYAGNFVGQSGSQISQGFTSLRYLDPEFLGSDYSFTEELRLERQDLSTQEFDQDRLSLATYWYKQLGSGVGMTAGHTILAENLDNVTPGAIIGPLDEGNVRLSFLSASLTVDRRDDPLLPRSGYTFRLDPKVAADTIGSEGDYATLTARTTGIVPLDFLSPRFSLGTALAGGASWSYGSTEEIPITQRFYLGGRRTVRGFRENSLGPRGSDGAVIGGDTMVAGNLQLQYLFADSLQLHTFLDAGNVYLRDRSFSLADVRWSSGVGVRYLSPIGPIGLDLGRPLDEKSGEPSVRIHFSVGSTF